MTEEQWLSSTDPQAMLELLSSPEGPAVSWRHRVGANSASDRKLRLFVYSSLRQIWPRFVAARNRQAMEVAERYADGEATTAELAAVAGPAVSVPEDASAWSKWSSAALAAALSADWSAPEAAAIVVRAAGSPAKARQAALLRDLFGSPFRPLARYDGGFTHWIVPGDPDAVTYTSPYQQWNSWHDGLIPTMARAIYDERCFENMPVLADALEEAGCTNEDLLMHCRGWDRCFGCLDDPGKAVGLINGDKALMGCGQCNGGTLRNGTGWIKSKQPHVRGCWCLDLILGKS